MLLCVKRLGRSSVSTYMFVEEYQPKKRPQWMFSFSQPDHARNRSYSSEVQLCYHFVHDDSVHHAIKHRVRTQLKVHTQVGLSHAQAVFQTVHTTYHARFMQPSRTRAPQLDRIFSICVAKMNRPTCGSAKPNLGASIWGPSTLRQYRMFSTYLQLTVWITENNSITPLKFKAVE
jgi:hypothetical protein